MAAVYPSTLPGPIRSGYEEQSADNTIRSEMDVGPPKVRRRATAATRFVRWTLILDESQYDDLETFYGTTCKEGAITFDYTDPHGNAVEYRFAEPPRYAPFGIGWTATINLVQEP